MLTCPVAHLVTLGIHDNAFKHARLKTAQDVLSLRVPEERDEIVIPWSEGAMDLPIFRGSDEAELDIHTSSKRLLSLGRQMGY